jgi:hypothetical protein
MSGRILSLLALAVIPAAAQVPAVLINNVTRPGSADLQIGDRFEIVITGCAGWGAASGIHFLLARPGCLNGWTRTRG